MVVFINGIFEYFKSKVDHENQLCIVLQTLKDHHLFAKFLKCKFWLKVVTFLGHVISSEGIIVDL